MWFKRQASQAVATGVLGLSSFVFGAGSVVHVDDDAPPGGDGASWDTAYRFLQDGLTSAAKGGVTEIRVAQGIYKPDRDEANPDGTGDREAAFHLLNDVPLRGGYAGIGAKDPDARDIELYETTLSGDLLGNDGPDFQNNDENSYHVLIGPFTKGSPVLDGVTVTRGNGDGPNSFTRQGAGLFTYESTPILVDCLFTQNAASFLGGATFHQDGCTAVRCKFVNNMGGSGGAVFNGGYTSLLEQCTFVSNSAFPAGGGAIRSIGRLEVIRSTFIANETFSSGGAINADTVSLLSCVFIGNSAGGSGGGINLSNPGPGAQIINCTFAHNSSADLGGGLQLDDGDYFLSNCIVWGNTDKTGDGEGAQISLGKSAVLEINYSCIQGWTGNLGGFGNIGDDPLFVDPAGPDGIPGTLDDDLHLADGSPCVNRADSYAGFEVGFVDIDGEPRIQSCRLDMGAYESPFFASDCNDNGEADACDLANSTSSDCNQNGILDECDIAEGSSEDCNGNGFPDECDVEPAIYRVDDGTAENTVGLINGGVLIWLNAFVAMRDGEVIEGIDICWGMVEKGTLTDLAIWLDPSNDGDPTDAVLVTLVENIPAENPNTGQFNTIPVPPTPIGDAGDVFFVGARITHDNNEYPACIDLTPPSRESSWFVSGGNLEELWNNQIPPTLIDDDCCPGNWLIRARRVGSDDDDDNGIPDECEPPDCPWDLDGSGDVGVSDFLALLGAWGPCPPKGDCAADFDNSGAVGVSDFLELLGNWGPCP